MKVAAVCLSTTHAKSAMGLSWKWRQSDTRHNLKTMPTPTPTVSLHCEKLPPTFNFFIKKKKKKCLKADM